MYSRGPTIALGTIWIEAIMVVRFQDGSARFVKQKDGVVTY
jgi:hypothetical protein